MPPFAVLLLITVALGVIEANPTSRVLGGENASFKQFAHQISLRYNHAHTCGGSIISRRTILTAAHCVVNAKQEILPAKNFTIRAGTINRIAGGVLVQVKNIIKRNETDVALVELEEDLVFSDSIQAIELFDKELPANSDVIISGWGLTVHAGAGSPIYLQYLHVKSISKSSCARKILQFDDGLLCLSHPKDAGACNGDSGGPATHNGQLVGIAGFVVIKCGSSKPDGYAKVAYNLDWIRKNMV